MTTTFQSFSSLHNQNKKSTMNFYVELNEAEEESNRIMVAANELSAERDALAERLEALNKKAQELTEQRCLLNEKIHKLMRDINNFQQEQEQEIQSSEIGYFIADDGYCYVDTFEREWVNEHAINLSGPLHCSNCETYGTIIQDGRIIFLGYCLNCARYMYNNERGHGFQGFDNIEDKRVIENDGAEHLKKYREQILSYITTRLDDTNFELQFPEQPVPSSPTATASVTHFDTTTTDCDCDCDSDNDVYLQETQRDYCEEDSSDDYRCDCCHPTPI